MWGAAWAPEPRACFTGRSAEIMAEDQPSREILKQLVERLDLLERVLGTTTARLHFIEQHLGIVRQQQPLHEPLTGESCEAHPPASQVKTQESKISKATRPTPPGRQAGEPEQTRSRPEAQSPRTTETPATHSWMHEPSTSRSYAQSVTDAPSGPPIQVENTAAENEASPPCFQPE